MSEEKTRNEEIHELPEAVVSKRKHQISIVWFVPLVALLIGGWLVYKTLSEKGPTVTISFKSAEGLEAGKTKIKYKNVELGQVKKIHLTPDLAGVLVEAELVKEAEDFLSANTRFWVVRARVAAGQVSGLGTIFSGAYIGLDPGKPGLPASQYVGLETPPVVTTDLPGRHFRLYAKRLGSLDIGAPVYYRQIKVGQVVSYKLNEDGGAIEADPFATQQVDAGGAVDWQAMSLEDFIEAVQMAGIVGMGGAAFPAHVKLSVPDGVKIRHLLINGAECEPYLTTDHRLMLERPEALLEGAEIMRQKLGAEETVIGVEMNKPDAIEIVRRHIKPGQPVRVVPLKVKYP